MSAPVQASPKASKLANDEYFGLTKAQVKLLLFGFLFTDEAGKVSYLTIQTDASSSCQTYI